MKVLARLVAGLAAALGLTGLASAQEVSAPAQAAALVQPDWASLGRYRADNALLAPASPDTPRVVFVGASTIENWKWLDPAFFTANPGFVNRGVSGQTTPQILVRFRQDVLNLKPAAVFILCGLNDIAGNTGPMSASETVGHIASMAELARANGIKVVLAALLPADRINWAPDVKDAATRVAEVNALLAIYAKAQDFPLVDFTSTLGDGLGGLKPEYTDDGVHLKSGVYPLIDEQAKAAITAALGA